MPKGRRGRSVVPDTRCTVVGFVDAVEAARLSDFRTTIVLPIGQMIDRLVAKTGESFPERSKMHGRDYLVVTSISKDAVLDLIQQSRKAPDGKRD